MSFSDVEDAAVPGWPVLNAGVGPCQRQAPCSRPGTAVQGKALSKGSWGKPGSPLSAGPLPVSGRFSGRALGLQFSGSHHHFNDSEKNCDLISTLSVTVYSFMKGHSPAGAHRFSECLPEDTGSWQNLTRQTGNRI